jgi:DUF4097 and DUF4098 domain-containing protein YvlB
MTMHRSGPLLLLCLAGAISVGLSGCKNCRMRVVHAASDARPVSIHHMGGDIDVADAPNGANVATMGGNIHLGSVGLYAKAKTMGGDISIDHASGSVDASTMGGKINIAEANGAINASTMGGEIKARLVGPSTERRDIELSSKGGTIVLVVPRDFGMEVRISLAYTKKAGDHFRIIDHCGLMQKESDDWETSHGTPRKYIRASGRVGSGMNHVTIETINGDVILKQE